MSVVGNRVVAVVDPVAAGGPYGTEIAAMGLSAVGVLTRDFGDPYTAQSLRRNDFLAIHRHADLDETIRFLRDHEVVAVVPGDQMALEWSDLLASRVGVPGNPVESMTARYNKRIMKERWTASNVPCADWIESDDLAVVQSWVAERGFPVVLKPNASTGSCHVFMCGNAEEVATAFGVITTNPDVDGTCYDAALVEEYLDGDEYFMNLLHHDGESRPVSMARYEKLQRDGRASIYRTIRSMPIDDPLAVRVLPQVQAANTALGVRLGINDTEFKMTSRGFRVIEINNRLPGAGTPLMIDRCSGLNCYRTAVELFMGEYDGDRSDFSFARHYSVCCLINDRAGTVVDYTGIDEVRALSSFVDMRLIAEVGAHWPVTTDLASAWGLVWLVNDDTDRLDADTATVHELLGLRVD